MSFLFSSNHRLLCLPALLAALTIASASYAQQAPSDGAAVTPEFVAGTQQWLDDAVGKAQARIHELAGQASADAAKAGPGQEAAGRRVAQARTEAEAAHADLASRQAIFRATAQTQVDTTAQALLLCDASPEFSASDPCVKLLAELAAAAIVIASGLTISRVTTFGTTHELGWLAIPAAALWILLITNAFNLVDGLDGLAGGLIAIAAATCGGTDLRCSPIGRGSSEITLLRSVCMLPPVKGG